MEAQIEKGKEYYLYGHVGDDGNYLSLVEKREETEQSTSEIIEVLEIIKSPELVFEGRVTLKIDEVGRKIIKVE